uniref:Uncharacterized protein n=1 Tax=Lepeophtheirus salmonis TaxID=72036 RepID=A0A0K2T6E5_LEPSM
MQKHMVFLGDESDEANFKCMVNSECFKTGFFTYI